MTVIDLEPATRATADLIGGIDDALLDAPTPCPDYTLGDLLDHIGGLALAFAAAATKKTGDATSRAPAVVASRLGEDWRTRIPRDLAAMARAWRDPSAWSGMTRVGGIDLPGEVAGVVGLDEVVIHGWDVARASGQVYDVDQGPLVVVHDFLQRSADSARGSDRGPFGPPIRVPDTAPLLERAVGLSGRDPGWSPTHTPGPGARTSAS
ncbi:MAG: TIGR03086 family metal-binding protein [Frankia sp.]